MSTTSRAFQLLRPACVDLSQTVLRSQSNVTAGTDLIIKLEVLENTLNNASMVPEAIDHRLAEYVFFPLSQVFKESTRVPIRATELSLLCLSALLKTGWRRIEHANLASQLLILLNFLATRDQLNPNNQVRSEQFEIATFSCMTALFESLKESSTSVKHAMLDISNLPVIGHSITVMLDGVLLTSSSECQLSALNAYNSFYTSLESHEVVASFLPGILSSLTKILIPTAQSRKSFKVLIKALEVVNLTLETTITDSVLSSISLKRRNEQEREEWLNCTSENIRIALNNIAALKDHHRIEVRDRLFQLFRFVVSQCRKSLNSSIPLALEVSILLSTDSRNQIDYQSIFRIAVGDNALLEMLKSSLYSWIQSLPRVLNGRDEAKCHCLVEVVSNTLKGLSESNVNLKIVQSYLETALRNTLTQTLEPPEDQRLDTSVTNSIFSNSQDLALFSSLELNNPNSSDLTSIFCRTEFSQNVLRNIVQLISSIASSDISIDIARNYLDELRMSQGNFRFINFWLLFQILHSRRYLDFATETFLQIDIVTFGQNVYDELQTLSVEVINGSADENHPDWRLQVLALNYLKLQADQKKEGYRASLVDIIFPVMNLAASSHGKVSKVAMNCLNSIAKSCGYEGTKNLVISNVDYLLNDISMKFNTLDVTPQSCQALSVMVQTFGSSLIPYLDDIVDSLCDALESFHGYSDVVGQIFSVLTVTVEQVVLSTFPKNPVSYPRNHNFRPHIDTRIESLRNFFIKKRRELPRREALFPSHEHGEKSSHFMITEEKRVQNENQTLSLIEEQGGANDRENFLKTYEILHKIISLTQHHLSSSNLSTRISLLSLLACGLPYMAKDEDKFLPLIHKLWPALESRLKDHENHAVACVLEVMGLVCEKAGDFMQTRIHKLWPAIIQLDKRSEIYRNIPKAKYNLNRVSTASNGQKIVQAEGLTRKELSLSAISSEKSVRKLNNPSSAYIPADISTLYHALLSFLVKVLNNLQISDSMFEIVLYVILESPMALKATDLSRAMRYVNPDSFWLFGEKSFAKVCQNYSSARFKSSPLVIKEAPRFIAMRI